MATYYVMGFDHSPADVLDRITKGLNDMRADGEWGGQLKPLRLVVPDERAEMVEEAAARNGVLLERAD